MHLPSNTKLINAVELISHAEDILAKTANYESIVKIYEDWLELQHSAQPKLLGLQILL